MTINTGLDYLRTKTVVDCDTLDEQGIHLHYSSWTSGSAQLTDNTIVVKTYGPFVDCTSNQVPPSFLE